MFILRFLILFSAIGFCELAHSGPVVIKGSAPGAAGSKVQIFSYVDFISNTEKLLAETRIGQDGFFNFRLDLKSTTLVFFTIERQRGEILLEPRKTYNLKISGMLDRNLRDKDIPPFQMPALDIDIMNPWRHELNGLVGEYQMFHDDFLFRHSMALVRQRDPGLVKDYVTALYDLFPGIDNAWFNIMLTHSIASVEMMARAMGREAFLEKYFADEPVLYDHMAYMDFFQQFYAKHIITSRTYNRNEIIDALNATEPYQALMQMLRDDPYLPTTRIRELVLIKNMFELTGEPGFDKGRVLVLLNHVQTRSNYPEHKLIAGNLVNLLRER